jgi:predicted nucleic acid-binding protein
MSWLLDPNLLLRFSDNAASTHQKACDGIQTLFNRGDSLHITAQNLIEFWAVATRPVTANGLGWTCTAADVWVTQLLGQFLFLDDTNSVFTEWRNLVSSLAVQGKKAHDARLVAVMKAHGLSRLLTFNTDDFASFTEIHGFIRMTFLPDVLETVLSSCSCVALVDAQHD